MKDFIRTLFDNFEQQITLKVVRVLILYGGLLLVTVLLTIALMLAYPTYIWCTFAGFVGLWIVSLLFLYAYSRILRAEQQARVSNLETIENIAKTTSSVIIAIIDHLNKSKK